MLVNARLKIYITKQNNAEVEAARYGQFSEDSV